MATPKPKQTTDPGSSTGYDSERYVDAMAQALTNRVPKAGLLTDLERYVGTYKVEIGAAAQSIVRKHGGDVGLLATALAAPRPVKPEPKLEPGERVWVEDMADRGGAQDVTLRGIVVDIREGSGLVLRCPECKSVLQKHACRLHGKVDGVHDLRTKAVVDDGSGAMTAVFGTELTASLLGKTLEQCVQEARDAMSSEVVRDKLSDALVAQPVEIRGDVTSDEYGLLCHVKQVRILRVDANEEARALLGAIEE